MLRDCSPTYGDAAKLIIGVATVAIAISQNARITRASLNTPNKTKSKNWGAAHVSWLDGGAGRRSDIQGSTQNDTTIESSEIFSCAHHRSRLRCHGIGRGSGNRRSSHPRNQSGVGESV